jgi:hypothetical protein
MNKSQLEGLLKQIEPRLTHPPSSFQGDDLLLWNAIAALIRALLQEKRIRWPPRVSAGRR